VGLIFANIGLSVGVLSQSLFTAILLSETYFGFLLAAILVFTLPDRSGQALDA